MQPEELNRAMAESSPETPLVEPDLDWGRAVSPQVEAAINRLIDRFVESPFRHRCEHSLHCDLMHELQNSSDLADSTIPLENGYLTQLIHKEWPEPITRKGKGKRGNIDVAVLTPLSDAALPFSLKSFREGRIRPFVGIELGLDYRYQHLVNDYQKLQNSGIESTYVVHLSRRHSPDQEKAWNFVSAPERNREPERGPGIAAVFLVGHEVRIKRPGSSEIEVRLKPQQRLFCDLGAVDP